MRWVTGLKTVVREIIVAYQGLPPPLSDTLCLIRTISDDDLARCHETLNPQCATTGEQVGKQKKIVNNRASRDSYQVFEAPQSLKFSAQLIFHIVRLRHKLVLHLNARCRSCLFWVVIIILARGFISNMSLVGWVGTKIAEINYRLICSSAYSIALLGVSLMKAEESLRIWGILKSHQTIRAAVNGQVKSVMIFLANMIEIYRRGRRWTHSCVMSASEKSPPRKSMWT